MKHSRVFFQAHIQTDRETDELGRFTLAEERAGDVTVGCLRWQVQVWSVYETFYLRNNPACLIHHQVWIPRESLMDNRTAGWLTFKSSFAMNRSKQMWFLIWLQYKSYTCMTTTKYTQTWFCSCVQTNQYSRSHYMNPQKVYLKASWGHHIISVMVLGRATQCLSFMYRLYSFVP